MVNALLVLQQGLAEMIPPAIPLEKQIRIAQRIANGEFVYQVAKSEGVAKNTAIKYFQLSGLKRKPQKKPIELAMQELQATEREQKPESPIITAHKIPSGTITHDVQRKPKILIFDLELLPNRGYFYERFSDYGIPQQFIRTPKALCAIGYKWFGDSDVTVLSATTPYDDALILKQFAPVWEQADYVVAHNADGFDIPVLNARHYFNKLPPLPPVTSIDTLKLARQRWKQQLNGNSLDHIAEMAGLGRKLKIDASLWVRCAEGDSEAMAEMIAYNKQDVNLLEIVFSDLLPHSKHKMNHNLFIDSPVKVCKTCGHDDLEHKGFYYTAATYRHRVVCRRCGSWSEQPKPRKK